MAITKRVFKALSQSGGYQSRHDIAKRLKVKRSSVNSAFQSLERSGKIVANPFVIYNGGKGRPSKVYRVLDNE